MFLEGDNMMGLKRANRAAVLNSIHEQGKSSRKRLAESTRLTPAAITKIVGEMIGEGILTEGSILPGNGAGRREILVEINQKAFCALGIMINIKHVILSAVWLDGQVLFSQTRNIPRQAPAEETLHSACAELMKLVKDYRLKSESILGVGIAIRGISDLDNRIIHDSFGALDTMDYPIAEKVEQLTGLRAVMANNVRALFTAQMYLSQESNLQSQFFLRCEYGIGASLSFNNRIWCGSTGQCSEIGHIPVIKRGGKPCTCGKSGCLETIASPSAIFEEAMALLSPDKTPVLWNIAKKKTKGALTIHDVLSAARGGDSGVAEIVDKAISALGSALKSVIYLIDPDKIVLYGRLFDDPYYLSGFLSEMQEGMDGSRKVVIEKSRFNEMLEDKAAALLVVEDFFSKGAML